MPSLYTNLAVRLRRNEKGATAVEYGIMVGLIAVVIIVAVSLLGGTMQTTFKQVQCQVGGGKWTGTVATSTTSTGGSCVYPTTTS